jgi:hypothetical protein
MSSKQKAVILTLIGGIFVVRASSFLLPSGLIKDYQVLFPEMGICGQDDLLCGFVIFFFLEPVLVIVGLVSLITGIKKLLRLQNKQNGF